jgi:bifunctional isochorismate lyase/aryl carrier protein
MNKERYFTERNLSGKARDMIRQVVPHERNSPFLLDPGSSALLVIDMQRYFTDQRSHAFLPSAPAIIEPVKKLMTVFRKNGRPVILTRHINTRENAGMLERWWNDLIIEKSALSALSAGLISGCSDRGKTVMIKTQYDAFYRTGLLSILKKRRVKQLVITGVMTHLCCETTARSAFVHGFEVFFVVDATATQNEEYHTAAIRNLAHGFAVPALTAEIIDRFRSLRASR